ncbi:MAG TPA: FHA domain-containing protein [Pirellulales bacterium]
MSPRRSAPRLRLFTAGPPRDVPLERPLRIGSDAECDVVVGGAGLDPVHLLVVPEGRAAFVEDLSLHGSLVNGGAWRGRRFLRNGDEIACGTARLLYLAADPADHEDAEPASPGPAADPSMNTSRSFAGVAGILVGASVLELVDVGLSKAASDADGRRDECPVCQTGFPPGAAARPCDRCGRGQHEDCWSVRSVCGACGGPAPVAPEPPRPSAAPSSPPPEAPQRAQPLEPWPWEHAWLGAAVAAALLSPATAGWASLLVGGAGLWSWRRRLRDDRLANAAGPTKNVRRPRVAWAALGVAGAGTLAGIVASDLLGLR